MASNPLAMIGGGIASMGGAIAGNLAQQEAAKRQGDILSEMMGDQVVWNPELDKRKIYQKLVEGKQLTPEQEQVIAQDPSILAQVQADKDAINIQKQALQRFLQTGQTGEDAVSRAAYETGRSQIADDTRAALAALAQQEQARGGGSSGNAYAQAMLATQQAAQRGNDLAMKMAALKQTSAQTGREQAAQLAGDIRRSSFEEAGTRGRAADTWNQLAAENMRDVQQRNVAGRNLAQRSNVERSWNVSDANIAAANKAIDDQEAMRLRKLNLDSSNIALRNTARTGMRDLAADRGQAQADMWNAIGQSVAGGTTEAGGKKTTKTGMFGQF